MSLSNVNDILDDYFDEGGSQIDLFQNAIIPIFNVSGFFTPAMVEAMEYKMKEADEQMNI